MNSTKTIFFTLCILFSLNNVMAQDQVLPLWPEGKIPNATDHNIREKSEVGADGILRISQVTVPTISVFLPEKSKSTGAAVLICPGGGYKILAFGHEGVDVAKWFTSKGVAAFVLKYRIPDVSAMTRQHEVPLMDAMQAMKLIRKNATQWSIDATKIGVMGFSAGGHLAATLSTQYFKGESGSEGARPDFSILLYPVITFSGVNAHMGSMRNLLGANQSEELIRYYSTDLQVSDKTPPAFLVHSQDDNGVPIENSMAYFLALKKNKIPAEAHFYPFGGHGYGMHKEKMNGKGTLSQWPLALESWLRSRQLVK